jgi:hypothetical protein
MFIWRAMHSLESLYPANADAEADIMHNNDGMALA